MVPCRYDYTQHLRNPGSGVRLAGASLVLRVGLYWLGGSAVLVLGSRATAPTCRPGHGAAVLTRRRVLSRDMVLPAHMPVELEQQLVKKAARSLAMVPKSGTAAPFS